MQRRQRSPSYGRATSSITTRYVEDGVAHAPKHCGIETFPLYCVDADWKICAENFAGDGYHLPVTHQFGVKFGYFPTNNRTHFEGYAVHIPGKGHGIGLGQTPGLQPFSGLPPAVQEGLQRALHPDQVAVFKDVRSAIATIFPNLSLVSQPFEVVVDGPTTSGVPSAATDTAATGSGVVAPSIITIRCGVIEASTSR